MGWRRGKSRKAPNKGEREYALLLRTIGPFKGKGAVYKFRGRGNILSFSGKRKRNCD